MITYWLKICINNIFSAESERSFTFKWHALDFYKAFGQSLNDCEQDNLSVNIFFLHICFVKKKNSIKGNRSMLEKLMKIIIPSHKKFNNICLYGVFKLINLYTHKNKVTCTSL